MITGISLSKGIEDDLLSLEKEVEDYLGFEYGLSNAETDLIRQTLLDDPIQCPEIYTYWLKLKLYSGNGPIPFLWSGGYTNQPYLTSLQLEAVARAEKRYSLKSQSELLRQFLPNDKSAE